MTIQSPETRECIEILSTAILEQDHSLVEEFRLLSRELGNGLGWHYLLDLAWVAKTVGSTIPGMRVLDAGAGIGVMQWWLAGKGIDVLSVDRNSRRYLRMGYRRKYLVEGLRKKDLKSPLISSIRALIPSPSPRRWSRYPQKAAACIRALRKRSGRARGSGRVVIYNQDLTFMPDIADSSVDAVVSVSALEHNPPEHLRESLAELMRVLKPGGRLIATLAASRDKDWHHEPSQGWCYTETTLRDLFDLRGDCPSNYVRYDELFEKLRSCRQLRDNLADFYKRSGNNGMPWGRWDPQYQPVGLVKMKRP